MIQDLKLAGLAEGTSCLYVRAVRQLTAYYMVPPDRLTERQVEQYLLYVRDELGVARGTFQPMVAGLKFFYLYTLGYNWLLFTKKKPLYANPPTEAVSRSSTPTACGFRKPSHCPFRRSTRSRWCSASSERATSSGFSR